MTKPAPEPRPPTILGEYGEGYCRHCHFTVGLDRGGLLNRHVRGQSPGGPACDGSHTTPPKITPYRSRLAAFRTTADTVVCPSCGQTVDLAHYASGTQYSRHLMPNGEGLCLLSSRPIDMGPPPERTN